VGRFFVVYDQRAATGSTDDAAVMEAPGEVSEREAIAAARFHDGVLFSYAVANGDELVDEQGPHPLGSKRHRKRGRNA
jgi:hypothetical protein